MSEPWARKVALAELARGAVRLHLSPDAAERARIADALGLENLPALVADLTVRPWLDGAELTGRFQATVEQVCGVSLDVFEQPVSGDIALRFLPAGSPNASTDSEGGELLLDPEAPDPPEVLEGQEIDPAAVVVEHLALEIDPFPRKPGATFDYTPPSPEPSPFDVLKQLKDKKD